MNKAAIQWVFSFRSFYMAKWIEIYWLCYSNYLSIYHHFKKGFECTHDEGFVTCFQKSQKTAIDQSSRNHNILLDD